MIQYRPITADELSLELFSSFIRRQVVTQCMRKIDGEWRAKDIAFVDDWSPKDYAVLVACLQNTLATGGFVYGALTDGKLKGFVSVESEPLGRNRDYLDLSSIHVSADMRGHGIGARLFCAAKQWAAQRGAKKLYISAHSAVESQAFYRAMGCVEAEEYNAAHVEKEPCDCQLECRV